MKLLMLSLLIAKMGFAQVATDESVLGELLARYRQCESTLSGAAAFECKKAAYALLARGHCRQSILRCQENLSGNGLGFLDPARCERAADCRTVMEGGREFARLSIGPTNACHTEGGSVRAELTDPYLSEDGEFVEYSFDMRMPNYSALSTRGDSTKPLPAAERSLVVAQLKAVNDDSPTFAIRLKGDGRLVGTIRHDRGLEPGAPGVQVGPQDLGSFARGAWLRIRLRIKPGSPGIVHAEINGRQVWNYEGPVGYEGLRNYFKIGPYDWSCTQATTFAIDYDNFSRTRVTQTVAPEGPAGPMTPGTR